MKKLLSLGLVAAMAVSAMPMAYATNVYENPNADTEMGTQVDYLGSKTTLDDDGNEVYAEAYTVTVPAKMAPGGSSFVKAEGTWNSARKLVVTADKEVVLENNINANDKKTLGITFNDINLVGNNNVAVANYGEGNEGEPIAVANIENALFGTWEGVFEYQAEIVDNVELITFTIGDYGYDNEYVEGEEAVKLYTLQAEKGMTWGDWANSKYNTVNVKMDGVHEGHEVGSYQCHVYLEDDGAAISDTISYEEWSNGKRVGCLDVIESTVYRFDWT